MGPLRPLSFTRRQFIATSAGLAGSAALTGCDRFLGKSAGNGRSIPGSIVGANSTAGHRLRTGNFPAPSEELDVEAVVLGGGIAGLTAARELKKLGVSDLLLFELENEVGGNSLSGRNAVSAYPWGAHYLPLPNEESPGLIAFLEELGVIKGRDSSGAPIYDEYALCADPMERLHYHGAWQEGVIPRRDLSAEDREQYERFFAGMDAFRFGRGSDGKRPFSIPVDLSSSDARFRELDQITMAVWLAQENFHSAPLRWYIDYACRDDYGAGIEHVSAWAGIHYFAARNARAANAAANAVLTWPEGNGWLVAKLRGPLAPHIRSGHLVCNIAPATDGSGVTVDVLDLANEKILRVRARSAICALPRFAAQHLVSTWRNGPPPFARLEYSPWMVANLTLDSMPDGAGPLPAWDNVIYGSRSLGYVVATHQQVESHPQRTIITYYQPLDESPPRSSREQSLVRTHADWSQMVVADLSRVHPAIAQRTTQLDVWLWGHAMIRPTPGLIWGETRERMKQPVGSLFFAHSDMSGISIFEEAFTRGLDAARAAHRHRQSGTTSA